MCGIQLYVVVGVVWLGSLAEQDFALKLFVEEGAEALSSGCGSVLSSEQGGLEGGGVRERGTLKDPRSQLLSLCRFSELFFFFFRCHDLKCTF